MSSNGEPAAALTFAARRTIAGRTIARYRLCEFAREIELADSLTAANQ
jgi:hypothetical protein